MSNLQKTSLILGIIISSAIIIGAVDAYNKSQFACKDTEAELTETNIVIASMIQTQQKNDIRGDIRFMIFELRQLEGEYAGKPKDRSYIIRKMDLEQRIKEAENQLKQLKGK